jgi:AraC-like DNA-binding protein
MQIHFSTDEAPPEERLGFWRERFGRLAYVFTPGEGPDDAFRAQARGAVAGGFALLEVETSLERRRRTEADSALDKTDAVLVRRFRRPAVWRAGPRSAPVDLTFEPGDICVSAGEWPFEEVSPGGAAFLILIVPREALSPLIPGGRILRPFKLAAGAPLGSLLGAALEAARAQTPLLPDTLTEAVLRHLCGLLALACSASAEDSEQPPDSARSAQLAAVKRHVEANLTNPDLSPAGVAAACGVSLRQLHRLFEPSGTSFARYVLRQRLIRCRDAIAGAMGTGRSVIDVAYGWGFNSMATFYRAFAGEFGAAPAALRETAPGGRL